MSYASEVLADNPYLYYRANETSAGVVTDSSPNGRNTLHQGAPTLGVSGLIIGDANKACRSFTTTKDPMGQLSPDLTLELLHQPTTISGYGYYAARDNNSSNDTWALRRDDNKVIVFAKSGQDFQYYQCAVPGLVVGTRYHIAMRFTANSAKLSVYDLDANAMLGEATTAVVHRRDLTPNFMFGCAGWTPDNAGGVFDEMALYESYLPDIRLAARYAAANGASSGPKIKMGSTGVSKLYLGANPVAKAYLGATSL